MLDVDETTAMASDWNILVWWQINESVMVGASTPIVLSCGNQLTITVSGVVTSNIHAKQTLPSSFSTITKPPGFILNPTLGRYTPTRAHHLSMEHRL
jgi:hypothetical protein